MIELITEDQNSTLTIKNDGESFPDVLLSHKGIGLQIMGYRAEMIDGELSIQCGKGGGTIVTCAFSNKKAREKKKYDYKKDKEKDSD